jgi:hypothetical protein
MVLKSGRREQLGVTTPIFFLGIGDDADAARDLVLRRKPAVEELDDLLSAPQVRRGQEDLGEPGARFEVRTSLAWIPNSLALPAPDR